MIFFFSGTGNSKWVATKIAQSLDDRLIDISDRRSLDSEYSPCENEKIGFIFPVYAWGPPKVVVDFIKSVNIKSPLYIYFICCCGDETGLTGTIVSNIIKKRSWPCNAGFSVIMPNTYVSLPGFDIDDVAIEKNKVMGALARIEHICSKLKENVVMSSYECHIGPLPFLKSRIIYPLFNKFGLTAKPYNVDCNLCISCGKCEKACSVGNVKLTNGHPVWGNNCTQCLACYHACPTHAIEYGKMTKNKRQYKGKYLD